MATNLGQLDLTVKADEQQMVKTHEKAGAAAGRKIGEGMAATAGRMVRGGAAGAAGVAGVAGGAAAGVAGAAAGGVGGIGGGIAGGAGAAAAGAAGRGAGAAAGIMSSPLLVIGAVVAGLAILATTVKRVVNTLMDDARRLASVNGPLAMAEAISQVMQIRRDIGAGAAFGQPLAALKIQFEELKNAVAPIVNLLKLGAITALRVFTVALEAGANVMRFVTEKILSLVQSAVFAAQVIFLGLSAIATNVPYIGEDLSQALWNISNTMAGAVKGIQEIRKQLQAIRDGADVTNFNMMFLEQLKRMSGGRLQINRDIRGVNVADSP